MRNSINDEFIVSKTVERAQLILELSFNIALLNERVTLFAVLCEVGLRFDSSKAY
jgi:hypothetical protein